MRILRALALLTSIAVVPSLRAQSPPDTALEVGTRIRVQAPVLGAKSRIGNFVSLHSDTLYFTRESETVPTRIPIAQLSEVDVSLGKVKNNVAVEKHALIPEIIGAAAGVAIGIAAGSGSSRMKAILGAAGGLGGFLAGHTYAKITVPPTVERWQPVTLRR